MVITCSPPLVHKKSALGWVSKILDAPNLGGVSLPSAINGKIVVYINDSPKVVYNGNWAIDGDLVYCGGTGGNLETLSKLGIISSIANYYSIIDEAGIRDRLSTLLVKAIKDSVMSFHQGLIIAAAKPSKLAIDMEQFRIAAQIDDNWYLPGGTPIGVTESWVTMDF